MTGEIDRKDKNESRKIAILLIALVVVLLGAVVLLLPSLAEFSATQLAPGVGLKQSLVISFFVTVVLLIVFAIASGDGLIGELQFILPAFFLFFIIISLCIAWVF